MSGSGSDIAATVGPSGYNTRFQDHDIDFDFEDVDPSNDLSQPPSGWPQVARVMALTPGFEAFQAFKDLNLKSLLYYQAELVTLRKALHKVEWQDFRNQDTDDSYRFAEDLGYLFSAQKREDGRVQRQWKLVTRIREILKEYNAALLQYSQISALPRADSYDVESLQTWLRRTGGSIKGPGADTWGDLTGLSTEPKSLLPQFLHVLRDLVWAKSKTNDSDLIVPRPEYQVDSITQWMTKDLIPFYNSLKIRDKEAIRDEEAGSKGVENKHSKLSASSFRSEGGTRKEYALTYLRILMVGLKKAIVIVTACLIPTLAIGVLASVHHTTEMIVLIGVFAALFAIGLIAFGSQELKAVDIFNSAAVFSAVMVVFVQARIAPH